MNTEESTKTPSALGESALWILATLFMTAMALVAVGSVKLLLGWEQSQWLVMSAIAAVLSLTWGSWAALLWTHSRVLKTLMVAVTVVPGMAMLIAGGWVFLNMPENPVFWKWGWAIVAAHGAGALAFALFVCIRGLVGCRATGRVRNRRLAMGWTLFPMLVVAGSVAVIVAEFFLLPEFVAGGETTMASVARWTLACQGVVLLTTALPAGTAHLCHRLAQRSAEDK